MLPKMSLRREEMHFGAALLGRARHLERRHRLAHPELHLVQLDPSRLIVRRSHSDKRIDHRDAHAMQAARDLVRVVVELARRRAARS